MRKDCVQSSNYGILFKSNEKIMSHKLNKISKMHAKNLLNKNVFVFHY